MRRLIIRPGAIGDCILAFPAMQHLAATYTEVWIATPVVPLVHFADRVRSISSTGLDLTGINPDVPVDEGLRQQLLRFDHIVSWYGANREDFRTALQSIGVPCTFLTALPPQESACHATDYFCSQVDAPLSQIPRLVLPTREARQAIVIQPFSGSPKKNWSLARYQQLAGHLPWPVEWLAGPEETLDNAARFSTLQELAEWISGASLYIGNDSGITHLAAAAGIKTIALFGPTDPSVWAPRGTHVKVIRADDLAQLSVDEVAAGLF